MSLYRDSEWVKRRYAETHSIYTMAQEAGCCPKTIHNALRRYGVEPVAVKGRHHTEETRRKISASQVGRPGGMAGKHHTAETRQRMSEARKGSGNANWKGGKTKTVKELRHSAEYKAWRLEVLTRADFKCQKCGSTISVEAHHIISINRDISRALDIDNGEALCKICHKEEHQ